jgi:hypothetical protein
MKEQEFPLCEKDRSVQTSVTSFFSFDELLMALGRFSLYIQY